MMGMLMLCLLCGEPFIGHTVKVYCGYEAECGTQFVDSLSIMIVDEE